MDEVRSGGGLLAIFSNRNALQVAENWPASGIFLHQGICMHHNWSARTYSITNLPCNLFMSPSFGSKPFASPYVSRAVVVSGWTTIQSAFPDIWTLSFSSPG